MPMGHILFFAIVAVFTSALQRELLPQQRQQSVPPPLNLQLHQVGFQYHLHRQSHFECRKVGELRAQRRSLFPFRCYIQNWESEIVSDPRRWIWTFTGPFNRMLRC